ncbi:MAG: dienelactone hydrolase family protein [Anaerolineae bacterium]|nr:dienelactone hydrolase family protein [Anaerolineae bacterium]
MFEAHHLQHNITSGYIRIISSGYQLPAFWAHPELGGPFPGLVILHDQWGLTRHVRTQARRFAEQGYYVIAPDLFSEQTANSEQTAKILIHQLGEAALSHVTTALNALHTHHKCNSTIGAIGWGMGGYLALRAAVYQEILRAVVTFYCLPKEAITLAELRMISDPMLAIFGAEDELCPLAEINALRTTLDSIHVDHEVIVYEAVGREFFNDSREGFHAETAECAWNKALAFLNLHLTDDTADPPDSGEFRPGKVY